MCNISARVAWQRADHKWSQETLAEKAGVDRKTISRLETGNYNVKWNSILAVLNVLGIEQCTACNGCRVKRDSNGVREVPIVKRVPCEV